MDIPAGGTATVDAPWGINPATGKPFTKSPEERARIGEQLAAARARKATERQAEAAESAPDPEQLAPIDRSAPDREPGAARPRRRTRRGRVTGDPKPPVDAPPFKAGPIAKGMNRLYAKAGRLVKMVHPLLGEALLSMTRKESDDDETVGEAWEALAQVSPVWRVRLLKLCTGGAAGRVLMAHAPILLAILMLEPVQKRMPFAGIVNAVFNDDEQPATSDSTEPTAADLTAMMAMAAQMMGPLQRAAGVPRMPGAEDLANGMWPAGENPDGSFGAAA